MENTNRKELRIVRGEEYKIQIRGSLTEQDPFWNQYEMATNILEQILSDAKKEANVTQTSHITNTVHMRPAKGFRGNKKA